MMNHKENQENIKTCNSFIAKRKILFVCLGNICRSPAAHGIMQTIVDRNGQSARFSIDSAGIGGWHVGQLPDERMRRQARARGYELTHHARQFNPLTDFELFDYIITMDDENYAEIIRMARTKEQKEKVVGMSQYFVKYKDWKAVPDPYYGVVSDFDFAIDLIEDGCEQLFRLLVD